MTYIYVDADACPVKDEVLRVAERHGLNIYLVGNSWIRGREHPLVRQVLVEKSPDAADDWIAEAIDKNDIVITTDIPLAARCLKKNARALKPNGAPFTEDSIGMALATRDLMSGLRETGEITGGPAPFAKKDRSRFLNVLETTVQAILRDNR